MTAQAPTGPNKWHRIGVILSLFGLALSLVALVLIAENLPTRWHTTTRHSDRPEQVEEALAQLEKELVVLQAEVDFRVNEIRAAAVRANRKAVESSMGIGESGGPEPERDAELKALAPRWEKAAAAAQGVLAREALRRGAMTTPENSPSAASPPATPPSEPAAAN